MKKTVKKLSRQLSRSFRKWHRKLGVFAAFFIVFLSVTGVALNHTEGLSLAHQPIKSTLLLDYYGISVPQDVRFYQQQAIQVVNNSVWLKGQLLFESDADIVSVGQLLLKHNQQKVFVIATRQSILLYNLNGELVDKLGTESGVPERIKAMSINAGQVIIDSANGYYQTDSDFFDWQIIQPINTPQWLKSELASDDKVQQAELAYRAQFLTLERIIIDSHSGRILGDIGVLFMDFIALLLILLSISGLYIWVKYSKNTRK
ncbi:MAG: PepSY domain-containing protein [Colwellia sp.]